MLEYTLKIFDWFLTLDMEVFYIWQAPWNVMKGLYLLARYMPCIELALAMICRFIPHLY